METLACPHCARRFHAGPAVLGKNIRCRGCRQIFHVPHTTAGVPLAPLGGVEPPDRMPTAVPCVVEGLDGRRCPDCGRTFLMKPAFVGTVIRCRSCRFSFRVTASHNAGVGLPVPAKAQSPFAPADRPAMPPRREAGPAAGPVAAAPPRVPRAAVFDDIGDVLDDIAPGEQVASVVRPREVWGGEGSGAAAGPMAFVLATLCAVPITQLLLWWVFGRDPLGVAESLPEPVRWLAPESVRRPAGPPR